DHLDAEIPHSPATPIDPPLRIPFFNRLYRLRSGCDVTCISGSFSAQAQRVGMSSRLRISSTAARPAESWPEGATKERLPLFLLLVPATSKNRCDLETKLRKSAPESGIIHAF